MELTTAYISLGSNLGRKVKAIEKAVGMLKRLPHSRLTSLSSLYETSPVDMKGDSFLNAVAEIETTLTPRVLMEALLDVETVMGRKREHQKVEARHIDLDLLIFGEVIIAEDDLTIPHPRMLQRRFVMEPLAEMTPGLRVPLTGITVSEVAKKLKRDHPEQEIKRLGTLEEIGKK